MAKDDREIIRGIRMPAERVGNKLKKGVVITDPDELEASGLDLRPLMERGDISGTWGRKGKAKAQEPAKATAPEEMEEAKEAGGESGLSEKTVVELREMAKEQGVEGFSTMKKAELVEALGDSAK